MLDIPSCPVLGLNWVEGLVWRDLTKCKILPNDAPFIKLCIKLTIRILDLHKTLTGPYKMQASYNVPRKAGPRDPLAGLPWKIGIHQYQY